MWALLGLVEDFFSHANFIQEFVQYFIRQINYFVDKVFIIVRKDSDIIL
jgi:hypothetical protein